jgi:hypothetical protein
MRSIIFSALAWLIVISPSAFSQNLWEEVDSPELDGHGLTSLVPWGDGVRAFFGPGDYGDGGSYWFDSINGRDWAEREGVTRYELDVTARLQSLTSGRSNFGAQVDDFLVGGDPYPAGMKTLEVVYVSSIGKRKAVITEYDYLGLPSSGHELLDGTETSANLTIESATYFYDDPLPLSKVCDAVEFLGQVVTVGAGMSYNSDRSALAHFDASSWIIDDQSWHSYYDGSLEFVAQGNGACVVVESLDDYYYDESTVYWSDNLSNWSEIDFSLNLDYSEEITIHSLKFLNGKFVAVGEIFDYSDSEGSFLASSDDGQNWTPLVFPGFEGLRAVDYNGAQWCAVGEDGLVLESTDGTFWSQRPDSGMDLVSLIYAGGRWVVAREQGGIYSSNDLATWVLQSRDAGPFLAKTTTAVVASDGWKFWVSDISSPGMPDVVQQPSDTVILPGSTATLTVVASGDETLTYQWYVGASGDETSPVAGASNTSFTTPPLTSTSQYWVRVTNALAYDDSAPAVVTVATQPVITTQPEGLIFNMGSNTRTSVTAEGGGLSYQWYLGLPGDTNEPLPGKTKNYLYPPEDEPGSFTYWVRVTNLAGSVDSQGVSVEVLPVLPVIYDQDLGSTVQAYEYKSYFVSATGPDRSYQWYQGESGDTSVPIDGTYSFYSPDTDHVGHFQYWVRVSNAAGFVDSATINHTVEPAPPLIRSQSGDFYVDPGMNVYLSVSAQPYNDLSYQWYEGERRDTSAPIDRTSSSYYPDTDTVGVQHYWVRVTNPYGSVDSRTFAITVRPSNYTQWAEGNELPTDGTGLGAVGASALGDGVSNLEKYALGLLATDSSHWQVQHHWYDDPGSGERYAAIWVRTLQNLPDIAVGADESENFTDWSASTVATGLVLDHGDGTVSREFRASQPISVCSACFLRARLEYLPEP